MVRYRQLARAVMASVLCGLVGTVGAGQAPARGTAAGPAMVMGTGAFTPFVENMDRSLAFYHDVFGMEVPPMPESGGARPFNNPNPRLFAFFDIMRPKERHESARYAHPHRRRADGDPGRPVQEDSAPYPGSGQRHAGARGARRRRRAGEGQAGRLPCGLRRRRARDPCRRHPDGDDPRRRRPVHRNPPAGQRAGERPGRQHRRHPRLDCRGGHGPDPPHLSRRPRLRGRGRDALRGRQGGAGTDRPAEGGGAARPGQSQNSTMWFESWSSRAWSARR